MPALKLLKYLLIVFIDKFSLLQGLPAQIIEKSGLYIMWNHKMVDDENNNYYKLGRTSNRESRLNSYASEYQIKKEDE